MDLDELKKEYEYMNEMIEQYPKLKTIDEVTKTSIPYAIHTRTKKVDDVEMSTRDTS